MTTGAPSGFSTPNQNASVTVQVNATSLSIEQTSVIIGQNLQTDARVVLAGVAPGGGLAVTVTSNDPSRLLLSTDPTAAGARSISLSVAGGGRATPTFYVQALGSSGNATYTASAPGFGNATQTVTLASSGFVISSPFGLGANFFTTTRCDRSEHHGIRGSTGWVTELRDDAAVAWWFFSQCSSYQRQYGDRNHYDFAGDNQWRIQQWHNAIPPGKFGKYDTYSGCPGRV